MCADSESAAAAGRPTESLQAYELVLQGRARYQRDKADPAAAREARELFTAGGRRSIPAMRRPTPSWA